MAALRQAWTEWLSPGPTTYDDDVLVGEEGDLTRVAPLEDGCAFHAVT
jgi:hypothetical protein